MSDLTFLEKKDLEKLFDMGSGYVLDFTDRTFQEFVADTVAKDIECARVPPRLWIKGQPAAGFLETGA